MSDEPNTNKMTLFRKIAAVAGAIGAVDKDGRNKDQGYRYPTPASVFLAVKPLLDAQGLAIVPHLVDFAEIDTGQRAGSGKPFVINRVSMHYHIIDGESGEEMVVPWQGQGGTYGDDKGLAKAQTIALRTFLIQLFQIPAEDPETDPDARDARPPQTQQQAAQRPPPARPATPAPRQPTPPASLPEISRADVITRIRNLMAKARDLGYEASAAELAIDLEEQSTAELKTIGETWRQRVISLKAEAEQPQPA